MEAKVDTSVTNAARISRLPGTMNRKGCSTPDRPHRHCTVLEFPEKLTRMTHAPIAHLAQETGYKSEYDKTRDGEGGRPTTLLDEPGVHKLISEFPELLELGRTSHDGDSTYFELLSCPFAGRPHRGQRVGKGKTTIRLSPSRIGFSCFSDECSDHTFGDLLKLLRKETGRAPSMQIFATPDLSDAMRRWGDDGDLSTEDFRAEQEAEFEKKLDDIYRAQEASMARRPDVAYMQRVCDLAESEQFQRAAKPPTLANYKVHWWDLYRSYACRVRLARGQVLVAPPAEMARTLGAPELFTLVHERIANRAWSPERLIPSDSAERWFRALAPDQVALFNGQ